MATVEISGGTGDAGALGDNRPWKLWAAAYQSDGAGGVVTTRDDRESNLLRPVAGVLTFQAEAGKVCYLENPDGKRYRVLVPETDADLWSLIEAAVAYPPDTPQALLDAAVVNALPPLVADELETQTAAAVTADLTARELTVTDAGGGAAQFVLGGVDLGDPFPLPAATLSGIAVTADDGQDVTVTDSGLVAKNPLYIDPTQAPYNVKADGRTFGTAVMSSSSNPTHLAVTAFFTAITVSGSPVLAGISRYDDIAVGKALSGTGIPVGAVVQSINDSGTVTMSANATADGINVAIYTPYTWTSADVGKVAKVREAGASSASLKTTVASVNTLLNRGVLADPALTTVSNEFAIFGTDNAAALDTLFADISYTGASLGRAALFGQGVVMYSGTLEFPFGGAVKAATGNWENMFTFWGRNGGAENGQGTVFYQIWDQNVDCARVRDASALQHDWVGCLEGFVVMQDLDNTSGHGINFRNADGDAVAVIDGGTISRVCVAGAAQAGWNFPSGAVGNAVLRELGAWGNGYMDRVLVTADTTSSSTTLSSVSSFTGLVVGGIIHGPGIPVDTVIMSLNSGAGTLVMSQAATATASGVDIQQAGSPGMKYTCHSFETVHFDMPSGDQNSGGLLRIVGTGNTGPEVSVTVTSAKNEFNVNAYREKFQSAFIGGEYTDPSIPQGANAIVLDNAATVNLSIRGLSHQAGSGSSVGGVTPNPLGYHIGAAILDLPTGAAAADITWETLLVRLATGSGQTTWYAFRDTHSANTLPIALRKGTNRLRPRPFRTVADTNAILSVHDGGVEWTSITSARTGTLPFISLVPAGREVVLMDSSGSASATNTITAVPAGSDTISGDTSISSAYGYLSLVSNGTNWVGRTMVTRTGVQTLTNKTLTDPRIATVKDANGATAATFPASASAVNYLELVNGATGSSPSIRAAGSDTNLGVVFLTKGNGGLQIYVPTGNTPRIVANGPDTNLNLNLQPKGTGVVQANGNPVGVKVAVPANASATGVVGQWAADSSYIYVCTATNTWMRAAIATW